MYPQQSPSTHTEQLGDEASVYDWARGQVHALNPTAARVWRQCDGATSRDAIAAVLRGEMGIPEAEAVVDLTLTQLARVHLLELPESRGDRSTPTRRWLLGRGLTAALLPAIYSITAPSPVDAQSVVGPAAPTLTSISLTQGTLGTTVAVTLTGTNFVIGATTVTVGGGGVTATNVIVSSATLLTFDLVIAAAATPGAHTVMVTTGGATSGAQTFMVTAGPLLAPTLTSASPNQGIRGETVAVTLTGTNFVVGGTTVAVAGGGVTVNTVVVGSSTSLTANFVLDLAATAGARTVTVTTAGGTSGPQTFTINLPTLGSMLFVFSGGVQAFTVPPGVTTLTVTARGAQGGAGGFAAYGGLGGSVTATFTVVPSAVVNVRVGGQVGDAIPLSSGGGFNGGGAGGAPTSAGGGGGASDIRIGGDALSNRVLVAGGGGGGGSPAVGGAGGGVTAIAGADGTLPGVTGGGGGTQLAGGSGGVNSNPASNGQSGAPDTGGRGGSAEVLGGGGGGGGYFGGGGGAGDGAAGGGGSSFADPSATGVVHTQGDRTGNGEVIITW